METTQNFDDVGDAIREGRALHSTHAYRILFAQENLSFRTVDVESPTPLGEQILVAAGLPASDGYCLFAILRTGDFEEVRFNEAYDLCGRGAHRFVAFKSAREFRLKVKNAEVIWGKSTIAGTELYELAMPGEFEAVFLVGHGNDRREISLDETVNLDVPGIEHFIIGLKRIEIVVNGHEVKVDNRHVTFEQLVAIAFPGESPMPDIKYSITYRGVASKPHSGELAAGGSVQVKNGSIFNVNRTVQS